MTKSNYCHRCFALKVEAEFSRSDKLESLDFTSNLLSRGRKLIEEGKHNVSGNHACKASNKTVWHGAVTP